MGASRKSLVQWMLPIALATATVAAVGCGVQGEEASVEEGELRPLERKAVGEAVPYPADTTLRDQLETLTSSQKARRAAAWKAVARALRPVKLADDAVKVGGESPTVPLWRTWYAKDDIERVFSKLYTDMTPAERRARKPFSAKDIEAAYAWNARDIGGSSQDDYFERVKKVTEDAAAQGLGGNHRVSYSPGFVTHLLSQYKSLYQCRPGEIAKDAAPPSATNFAGCLTSEFPADAAIVKASWYRANFGLKLPARDTSASTLEKRMSGRLDEGGWGKTGDGDVDPDESQIYSVKMGDGARFRLAALHLLTKELRDWFWITLWYSPDADSDYGADRPAEITALGGPWAHYKMNVTVAFEEKDPDPRGGFEGSLGDAIAATYAGVGGPSWASNPYLEKGAKNAQTNCIGCHQHAGSDENSESILASEEKFPKAGREKMRTNFPMDYTFALNGAPENLVGVFSSQIQHHDAHDPAPGGEP
jgi:hypothetical protein